MTPEFFIFFISIFAYTVGCNGIKGAPKHAENEGTGSSTPASVPANLDVYPEIKWYADWLGFSLAIGGNTPKASAVRKKILVGFDPNEGFLILSIKIF